MLCEYKRGLVALFGGGGVGGINQVMYKSMELISIHIKVKKH